MKSLRSSSPAIESIGARQINNGVVSPTIEIRDKHLRSWITTTVDNSGLGNAGQYNSIAVDTGGKAHISYSDGYTLKYATGP